MKRALIFALTLALAPGARAGFDPSCTAMYLSFDEEFNEDALDTSKWTAASGLDGAQYAQDEWVPANASESDGTLHLDVCRNCGADAGRTYESAIVTTRGKWSQTYGYFEARIKLPPAAHGLWPAFWLMPAAGGPPEIDIMEWLGALPNVDHMTYHFKSDDPATSDTGDSFAWRTGDLSKAYHVYGVMWMPDAITWYVDGQERHRVTRAVAHVPMSMILDNAVGAERWDGNRVDETTRFPATMEVDWVRAWALPGSGVAEVAPSKGFTGASKCD